MGGAEQILRPGDNRDALLGVVDGDGDVVADADVLAGDDNITEALGSRRLGAANFVLP